MPVENTAFIRSDYDLELGELLVGEKTSIGGQKCCKIFDTSNILTTPKLSRTKKIVVHYIHITIAVHSLTLVHFCS